jgi:hypothetical protein
MHWMATGGTVVRPDAHAQINSTKEAAQRFALNMAKRSQDYSTENKL